MGTNSQLEFKPLVLNFHETELAIIDNDGGQWLTGPDIARALGYQRTDKVGQIFKRYKDEFDETMSRTLNLRGRGHVAACPTRIYSRRGAYLIAIFARTDRAKEFRRWVLDALDVGDGVKIVYRHDSNEVEKLKRQASTHAYHFAYHEMAEAVMKDLRLYTDKPTVTDWHINTLKSYISTVEKLAKRK